MRRACGERRVRDVPKVGTIMHRVARAEIGEIEGVIKAVIDGDEHAVAAVIPIGADVTVDDRIT
jgi:hypothetical protein